MSEQPPTGEIYGRLTGRRRLTIVLLGALSGLAVAVMFAVFARQSPTLLELIAGAIIGALLGLSASLGEQRRKRAKPD
jgi:predicted membrane-bound spermidine synthase